MSFKLSQRSLDRMQGIDERMVSVVKFAITATKTDFGVIQGLRTLEMQKALVAKGASQTMKSKQMTEREGSFAKGGRVNLRGGGCALRGVKKNAYGKNS